MTFDGRGFVIFGWMQSDSLNTVLDSAAVDSAVAEIPAAEPEQIRISVKTDSLSPVVKGDTFEFKVNVSWQTDNSSGAVLILPTGSANAKGISQIGLREEHSRVTQGGKSISNAQFVYTLVADDSGDVSVPALRFQIPTANGPFEFQTESVAFRVEEPSHWGAWVASGVLALLVVLVAVLQVLRKRGRAASQRREALQRDEAIAEEFRLLKKRVAKADSRIWLLDLEKICKSWATAHWGSDDLEALAKAGKLDGWASLLKEFAHARYGGGDRDAFENKETWKLASKLLNIHEEE